MYLDLALSLQPAAARLRGAGHAVLAACLRVGLIKEGAGKLEERGRCRDPGEAAAGGVLGAQLLAGLGGGQVEGDRVDIGLGPCEAGLQGAIGMDGARFRRVSLSNGIQ